MSEVSLNPCPPQPDWQQLLQNLAEDNAQMKGLCGRLASDSATQYAEDMTSIASIESDESKLYSSLSREASKTSDPTQARADLAQLYKDLTAQRSNVAQINHWHGVNEQEFEYYADFGKAICVYNVSPDITNLLNDDK